MHSKNPFISDYNFENLIAIYPKLETFVHINDFGIKTIKFGDFEAVKALNTALLKQHYGLAYWNIPENNLCPPIPGRLDYLLHIADLFSNKEIHLLDIGTGANLIYPILATCHFKWKCTASEVNKESISNAQNIINKNTLLRDIQLRHQKFKSHIFKYIIQAEDYFDVIVCNPPFFKDRSEAEKNNLRKYKNLNLKEGETKNFGGLSNELWYKGGEEAFIKKMAEESLIFKNQVHWFTTIVSQKENLKNIKRAVNKMKPSEIKIVEMKQGNKQSRFIAWTFRN